MAQNKIVGPRRPPVTVNSQAVSLDLESPGLYIFGGDAPASWTFPELNNAQDPYKVKNISDYEITLNSYGDDQIFDSGITQQVKIFPGETKEFTPSGDYWIMN